MLEFYQYHQVNILIAAFFICLLLAFFVSSINFHSYKKKRALAKLEIGVAIILLADAHTRIFRGSTADLGQTGFKVSYFLMYLMVLLNQYFLNEYLTDLFMAGGRFEKLPKRLYLGFIVPMAGLPLLAITPFTGLYYHIDENLVYHRGPLFALSFAIPLGVLLMQFSFVAQYRDRINKRIFKSIVIYSMFPIVAGFVQIFFRGLSLLNLSLFLSAVVLFWFALLDQNEELTKAAVTELQTGLPNTYGFQSEIDRINSQEDITIYNGYYLDIVRMSQINNKYGKRKGDEVIVKYAHALRNFMDKDDHVGRLGGNYFVALVKKERTEEFLKLISDIPIEIEMFGKKETVHVAAIAGCYEITEKHLPPGKILGATSSAVNYAKNVAHKPYVFLDEELEKEFKRIRETEENTRIGLEKNEFEPWYQPKVDAEKNIMCGAEALVRWRHHGRIVSPFEFVSIMEKNGSVCELDLFVLDRVCKDIKEWTERGLDPVPVSVNFSRRNLGNPDLAESISKVVEKYGIPKNLIQIEITETLDEYPLSSLKEVVEELQSYGMTVAIDDFGTGSSSITLLKEIKFDVMKIDKTFIDYKNETEKLLLKDIIHMAENIGIDVVAEGVEEEEKVKELVEMGCSEIQGFYFDKPLEKFIYERKLENKAY